MRAKADLPGLPEGLDHSHAQWKALLRDGLEGRRAGDPGRGRALRPPPGVDPPGGRGRLGRRRRLLGRLALRAGAGAARRPRRPGGRGRALADRAGRRPPGPARRVVAAGPGASGQGPGAGRGADRVGPDGDRGRPVDPGPLRLDPRRPAAARGGLGRRGRGRAAPLGRDPRRLGRRLGRRHRRAGGPGPALGRLQRPHARAGRPSTSGAPPSCGRAGAASRSGGGTGRR